MIGTELMWSASVETLSKGYVLDKEEDKFICLICGEKFENGVIYPCTYNDNYLEAKKAISQHIELAHQSMFSYLLGLDKRFTGLSDIQKEILHHFAQDFSDKEIAQKLGGSPSTIRNHRFKLKEKEKQAKVFLAIMKLLEQSKVKEQEFISFHKGAKMVDERYAITEEERNKVLTTYFKHGVDGPLDTFPSKEKRKLIILQQILTRFEVTKKYTEKEINDILKTIFHDYVTLRRYLIEYGFMDRDRDGATYWVLT
ncbi:DUF2087 domain-containing protein [Robertmurraya massiliosenegalensis]|uniref:DUF2087 domain-containing protein n=1 Tax=Robertmurraya massiliosenegalensis TaxID=1287657 RepID=UPI00031B40B4|nr:DUF2087 domain-containing protein [Robertmurraya massiliosenegalensis]